MYSTMTDENKKVSVVSTPSSFQSTVACSLLSVSTVCAKTYFVAGTLLGNACRAAYQHFFIPACLQQRTKGNGADRHRHLEVHAKIKPICTL